MECYVTFGVSSDHLRIYARRNLALGWGHVFISQESGHELCCLIELGQVLVIR